MAMSLTTTFGAPARSASSAAPAEPTAITEAPKLCSAAASMRRVSSSSSASSPETPDSDRGAASPCGIAGGNAVDAREVEMQRDPFRGDARPHRVDGGLDDALQVHRRDVELQLAGDDARDVEDLVDQLRLRARAPLDRLHGQMEVVGG